MNYSFVLIGCGRIAERHAQQIKRLGKLVAVCDIDTLKAVDFAEKHSTKAYSSIEELLQNEKQIDIKNIKIVFPSSLRLQIFQLGSTSASNQLQVEMVVCLICFDNSNSFQ